MNILVDNSGYGLCNEGDKAMLQVGLHRLHALFPEATLDVICVRASNLQELDPLARHVSANGRSQFLLNGGILGTVLARQTGWETSLRISNPTLAGTLVRGRKKLKRTATSDMDSFLEAFARADIIVSTGGGFLNDTLIGHARMIVELLAMGAKAGKPTAMFGQGVGPITDAAFREFLKTHLPSLRLLGVREDIGARPLLEELGFPRDRVVVTGDDAVQLALDVRPAHLTGGIGVNVRVADYTGINDNAAQKLGAVVRDFAVKKAAPLVPCPISHCAAGADPPGIRVVLGQGDGGESLKTPLDVVRAIGQCRIVVTASYHAGVFALAQGISVVALSNSPYYDAKFAGLGDQFGSGLHIVHPDDETGLHAAMEQAWDQAPDQRDPLIQSAQLQAEASKAAFERFKREL